MFSTLRTKIILGIYVFLIISIPIGAYLASQSQTTKSSASQPNRNIELKKTNSPAEELKKLTSTPSSSPRTTPSPTPTQDPLDTPAVSFGPTLTIKLILEGRPTNRMESKVFVGIAEGNPTTNPKYVLSFTIDLPGSGIFEGLSLAGLTSGNKYTAYIKPTVQIATSSAFIMSSSISNLNGGSPLTLLTGDLNEDNAINSADYSLAKLSFGATPGKTNWSESRDFNKDEIINTLDISLIIKNFGKSGESGVWVSTPIASQSGSLSIPLGSPSAEADPQTTTLPDGSRGYWIFVPTF